jgi:hypothetical protein
LAEMSFNIKFDGYWREKDIEGMPSSSGLYCVYECLYNPENDTVSIMRLIYIGEASDVRDRISNHEKKEDWKRYVGAGTELCFSFGGVEPEHRSRVEAAFIFMHRPPENDEYKDTFLYDETTICTSGMNAKLQPSFTVRTTPRNLTHQNGS